MQNEEGNPEIQRVEGRRSKQLTSDRVKRGSRKGRVAHLVDGSEVVT